MSNVTAIKPRTQTAEWLSPEQVCERVPGMTKSHLEYLRGKRQGPRFFKPTPKVVVYAAADIDAWVADSAVTTRSSS